MTYTTMQLNFVHTSIRILVCIMSFINASVVFSKELFINEIQVANIDRFIDPSYNYGGWIELYNPGETSVQLSGYISFAEYVGFSGNLTPLEA